MRRIALIVIALVMLATSALAQPAVGINVGGDPFVSERDLGALIDVSYRLSKQNISFVYRFTELPTLDDPLMGMRYHVNVWFGEAYTDFGNRWSLGVGRTLIGPVGMSAGWTRTPGRTDSWYVSTGITLWRGQ